MNAKNAVVICATSEGRSDLSYVHPNFLRGFNGADNKLL